MGYSTLSWLELVWDNRNHLLYFRQNSPCNEGAVPKRKKFGHSHTPWSKLVETQCYHSHSVKVIHINESNNKGNNWQTKVWVSEKLTYSPVWISLHVALISPLYVSTLASNWMSEQSSVRFWSLLISVRLISPRSLRETQRVPSTLFLDINWKKRIIMVSYVHSPAY